MELYEAIPLRRSIRSYIMEPLSGKLIDELGDFISGLETPYEGIAWDFEIRSFEEMSRITGRPPKLQAPHFLILRSEKIRGCLQNAGYLGEKAVLFLTSRAVATCWQGALDFGRREADVLPYIIAVAFGGSEEPFRAGASGIKRKRLKEIAAGDLNGAKGRIIEAARLAPSGMGLQPCRYVLSENRVDVYRKKNLLAFPAISYMQSVDVGVALSHIELAAEKEGYDLRFEVKKPEPFRRKSIYQTSVLLKLR